MRLKSGFGDFSCDQEGCPYKTTRIYSLLQHLSSVHYIELDRLPTTSAWSGASDGPPLQDPTLDYSASEYEYATMIAAASDAGSKAPRRALCMQRHLAMIHGPDLDVVFYPCNQKGCDYRAVDVGSLKVHLECVHGIDSDETKGLHNHSYYPYRSGGVRGPPPPPPPPPTHFTYAGKSHQFNGRQDVTSITVQAGVVKIGEGAFRDCRNLRHVRFLTPGTLKIIGMSAFHGCEKLESILIPHSVTAIGERAFFRCTGLKALYVPPAVTNVGEYALLTASQTIKKERARLSFPDVMDYGKDRWVNRERRQQVMLCLARLTDMTKQAGGMATAGGRAVVHRMATRELEAREVAKNLERDTGKKRRTEDRYLLGALAYQMVTAQELWREIVEYL